MERRFPVFVDNFTSSSDFYSFGDDSSSDDEANRSSVRDFCRDGPLELELTCDAADKLFPPPHVSFMQTSHAEPSQPSVTQPSLDNLEDLGCTGDEIDKDFNQEDEGSGSDSFEKEMEMELNKEFSQYSQHLFDSNSQNTEKEAKPMDETQDATEQGTMENKKEDENVYDAIYFSSGSEDDEDNVGGVSSKSNERRAIKTDDELLYDPNMDDEDEQWVKQQRQEHHQEATCKDKTADNDNQGGSEKKTKLKNKLTSSNKNFSSDAILSCPACLTTLCIDCQRHDIYKQQFRAMFVMNCNVISDETLRYEAKKQKKKSSQKNKDILLEPSELYNPVQCTSCNTEVAVFDKDEVYHFFNVVESLP